MLIENLNSFLLQNYKDDVRCSQVKIFQHENRFTEDVNVASFESISLHVCLFAFSVGMLSCFWLLSCIESIFTKHSAHNSLINLLTCVHIVIQIYF